MVTRLRFSATPWQVALAFLIPSFGGTPMLARLYPVYGLSVKSAAEASKQLAQTGPSIGWGAGLISPEVYSMIVALVLVSTLVTPALLRFCFGSPLEHPERSPVGGRQVVDEISGDQGQAHGPAPAATRPRSTVRAVLIAPLLALLMLNTGCSVKKYTVNKLGDALAKSGAVYASDDDPELIREAVPFSLKLIESLVAESPKHRGLLLAASRGFTQYAYAFVQEEADETEARDLATATALRARSRLLYLRARNYGLRGLEVRHPGFESALREKPKSAVKRISSAKEVPLLYWTAASWGLAISISKDNPELVADRPIVEALIDRAFELDEGFGQGAIHSFLISYEPSRQGAKGDPLARSRMHFERAVEFSGGKLAGPYVTLAENVSVQKQDRAEFASLLKQALAINPDAEPESRLENLVMQRRARWLLARADDLFAQ